MENYNVNYSVHLPSYSIGPDCYNEVPYVTRFFGKTAVVLGGETAMEKAKPALLKGVEGSDVELLGFLPYGGDSTYENGDALIANPLVQKADMILAVGGGKACDTCKVLAEQTDKALFTFPTIASNCAPCTALAIMYDTQGRFKDNFYSARPPLFVFINDRIIAQAPVKYLQAGIGDALSKEAEVALALRHVELDQNLLLGLSLCAACTEPLLKYGEEAMKACEENRTCAALQEVALDIVISTGLVSNMTVCPEFYYNTNLAHCFYYGATIFPVYHDHLHGFWVAYGVLVLLEYDNQTELRDRVMNFYRKVGLPVTLAQVGLTKEDLPALADKASKVPGWHVDGYELTKEKFMQAVLNVDALGRKAA